MIKVNCICCNKLINKIKEDNNICQECNKVIIAIKKKEKKTTLQATKRLQSYYRKLKRKRLGTDPKEKKEENKPDTKETQKEKYDRYLLSDRWKVKKNEFNQSRYSKKQCFVCGSKEKLHVHHKTYDRLYNEELTDLVCLCKDCHEKVHNIVKFTKNKRIKLINAHVRLRNLVKNGMDTWDAYKQLLEEKIK